VLVVDDDPLVVMLLGKMLAGAGHLALTAEGYEAAVRHLAQRRFDAVITDLVMPSPGGVGVVAAARAACPEALIICISGRADIALVSAARDAGADDFVVKPFSPQSFVAELGSRVHSKRYGGRGGMPEGLRALLQQRPCPECGGSDWRLSPNWSEWSAPVECGRCQKVMLKAGQCKQCGAWGVEGESYTEAFGLCGRCASASARF